MSGRSHPGAIVLAFVLFALPLASEAQTPGKLYRIGFLSGYSAETGQSWRAAFRQGLRDLGYLEGQNIVIEQRLAAGRLERLPELATELVGLNLDIIVVHGGLAEVMQAAKQAGKTIPIVFAVHADPVGTGVVDSLARPGGDVTGLSDLHSGLVAKRLELLKEVLLSLGIKKPGDLDGAFTAMRKERPEALIVFGDA